LPHRLDRVGGGQVVEGIGAAPPGQQATHLVVGGRRALALGGVQHQYLARAQQLLADGDGAQLVGGAPAGVANHVDVAWGERGGRGVEERSGSPV
jgi:hypothetical protein